MVYDKPELRGQLSYFLREGTLDYISATLVHELIHRHHTRSNNHVSGVLTEAQAHFSGLYKSGPQFSIAKIVRLLSRPQAKGGYGFDRDQVFDVLFGVATLSGLGMGYDELSALIVHSKYDRKQKKFVPFSDVLEEKLRQNHIDDIDRQAIDDLYRLHANNEREKARLLFFQMLVERFSLETVRARHAEVIHEQIGIPSYYTKTGELSFSPENLGQFLCVPHNEEFPYDLNGKRTGIVFGCFVDKNSTIYGIGRWEAEGTSSRVDLAEDSKKIEDYLKILKEIAPTIQFDSKTRVFFSYLMHGIIISSLAQIVLKTLCDKNEGKKIIQLLVEKSRQDIISFIRLEIQRLWNEKDSYYFRVENVENSKKLITNLRGKTQGTARMVELMCEMFGLEFSEIAGKFQDEVGELIKTEDDLLAVLEK